MGAIGAVLLIAAPALLPYHAAPLPAFYQDWLAFAFGLLAALPVLWLRRGEALSVPLMALGFAGLASVLALQVVLGRVTFIESSVTGILYAAWAGLMVITGARLRETFGIERAAAVLQAASAAGGFLLAVTGFMQFYGLTLGGIAILAPPDVGMVGAVGQANYFANIVACALASLLYLTAAGKLRPADTDLAEQPGAAGGARARFPQTAGFAGNVSARLTLAALAGAPMVVALALSSSRSAWLFAAIILICAMFTRETRRLAAICALAAGVLVAAAWAASVFVAADFALPGAGRLIETLTGVRTLADRPALAFQAWHVFLAHPLLGVGWSEFAWNAFMLSPDLPAAPKTLDRHSHNLVLQLLAETGIAGAAAILVPLALWFCARPWRRLDLAETWIVTIAAIHLTQAMVELPHWYAYLLGPFALVLGLGSRTAVRITFAGWWRFAPRAILIAAIAVAAVRLSEYRPLEQWVAEASTHQRAGRPLSPEMLARLERLGSSIYAPEVELIAAQLQVSGDLDARLALNERAMHVFPLPGLATRRVQLLRRAGRFDEAEAMLRSIEAVNFPHPLPDLP